MIRDLPGNGIVVERLSHDTTDVGELNQLCQRAADLERGEGLTFPLTGVDPLSVMIDAPRKSSGRFLEPVLLVENRRTRIPGIRRVDASSAPSTRAPHPGSCTGMGCPLLSRDGAGDRESQTPHHTQFM